MVIRAILAAMVLAGLTGWPAAAAPARWQPNANATRGGASAAALADLGTTAMRKHLELDAWRAPC